MNITIKSKLPELLNLCKQHKIVSLYLFGSANTEQFDNDSDIDLLVTFGDIDLFDYFDNYIELKENLERIFDRRIDLIEEKTVKNPVLRRSINRNKTLIYGRTG
jgi:Predicted nucleotidyltransferases